LIFGEGMRDLFVWYLALTVLTALFLPITRLVLGNLPDKGWFLARPLMLLVLGFGAWFLPSIFQFLPYSQGWIIFIALVMIAGSGFLIYRTPTLLTDITLFARTHWRYILGGEAIFAGTLWLMGWLRSYSPAITGTEKFMDQAFLTSIIRAEHLPPPDPWMSGYSINYYYFGHFLLATLAKLLDTPGGVAFNVGIALIAALASSAIYGVAANLSAGIWAMARKKTVEESLGIGAGFAAFAAFMILVAGNLRSYWMWSDALAKTTPHFSWLDWLRQPKLWATYDWWNPSRSIPNTITEFPSFSFQLADLHAHVLALPFTVLAIGMALNLWLAPRQRGFGIFGDGWIRWLTLAAAGLIFGCLYTMNGWDLPTYLGLALIAIIFHQWEAHERIIDKDFWRNLAFAAGALIILSVIMFLPFYLNYTSPAQGIGIETGSSTHTALTLQEFNALSALQQQQQQPVTIPSTRTAIVDEIGTNGVMLFIIISWLLALLAGRVNSLLRSDGNAEIPAWWRSWAIVGGIGALAAIITARTSTFDMWTLIWALGLVAIAVYLVMDAMLAYPSEKDTTDLHQVPIFPLILVATAIFLIAFCEVFYLKDVFGPPLERMNTVFKFYFQFWTLAGITGAAGLTWIVAHVLDVLPGSDILARWQPVALAGRIAWLAVLVALVAISSVYALGASHAIYLQNTKTTPSLDGQKLALIYTGDQRAIDWMNAHISGSPVIVEASDSKSEYNYQENAGRISTFTGLPTVMGWLGHEYQWRVKWLDNPAHAADFNKRLNDIHTIYTSADNTTVMNLLHDYHVRYVYVGPVEQQMFGSGADLGRFAGYLKSVYAADGVTIYQVP
jgi:YYY domain-containing protein